MVVKKIGVLLLLGILLREAFSFWTGHPYDLELWVRTGYWVLRGVSPYGTISFAPGVSFVADIGAGGKATIAYLPFWPLLLGAIYGVYASLGSPTPLLYYSLIKQPLIISDVLLAYSLYRYAERRGSRMAYFVLAAWLLSPFNIILSGIWGMFDAIPVLFIVLALSARPGKYRGILAGMATFAKSIPLIYSIPLARGPRTILNLVIAIGFPAVLSLAIVWVAGWPLSVFAQTLQSTLGKGAHSLSLWDAFYYLYYLGAISSSTLAALSWTGYVWIGAVAVATVLAYKWFGFDTERGVVQSLILVTLAFLLTRAQVNEQYALYLFALALIDVAMWSPQRKNLMLASVALLTIAVVTNDVLLIRFLAPVYPQAVSIDLAIIAAFDPQRRALLFVEAMSFGALNIYYFYALYKERHTRTQDPPLTA
jgi:Gpi18-like mannosyltransferase